MPRRLICTLLAFGFALACASTAAAQAGGLPPCPDRDELITQHQVDTVGAVGQRPRGADPVADRPGRRPAQRERAQTTGIRDGGGQVGRRRAPDRRLHDRRRQAEPAAERCLKARRSRVTGASLMRGPCRSFVVVD